MSGFLPVLTVGLIILAIMFLIFGGIQVEPQKPRIIPFDEEEEEEEILPPPPVSGVVGFPQETTRNIPIAKDFSVSFDSGDKSAARLRNSSVENGLFGKIDREISFDATNQDDIRSARIRMNITDTNLYGLLVVKLNDEILFNNYSLVGKLEIPVNISKLKPANNILKIEATSSGWRIWAPSVYLFDADVLINYYSLKARTFDFTADKDIRTLTKARLVIVISNKTGAGNLIARINGVEVLRENKTRLAIADFSPFETSLKETNTMELLAEKDAKYDISSAEILLSYQPTFKTQTLYYNLTSGQYSSLGNVTLSFDIQKISGDVVSVLVKITDGAGRIHSIIPQGILREGRSYSVTLTKGDLYAGSNRIEFITSGGGSVTIANARVG